MHESASASRQFIARVFVELCTVYDHHALMVLIRITAIVGTVLALVRLSYAIGLESNLQIWLQLTLSNCLRQPFN
jgi:hypothetical protein